MPSSHSPDKLWYEQPAANWEQALPLGNGRLGSMVSGSPDVDHLWMNEDSVWHGGPQHRTNPFARDALPEVRELLLQQKVKEAEDLLSRTFTSMPAGKRHYLPLGDVYLHFGHATAKTGGVEALTGIPDLTVSGADNDDATGYVRSLDLKTSVAETKYTFRGVDYTREYFASIADEVTCVRLTATRPASISFTLRVHRCSLDKPIDGLNCMYDSVEAIPQGLLLKAKCGGQGAVEAAMGVMVILEGAQAECLQGSEVVVRNADSALVLISGETDFRNPDAGSASISRLVQASRYSWDDLLSRHRAHYSPLYSRVSIDLGHSSACALATDKRIARVKSGEEDECLIALLVNFARYLLISCSLSGLPANIQGLWNKDFQPAWGSKFTININVQMNYWPAEVLNLSECHQPLFDFIERLSVTGSQVAQEMYGCRGFVAHHSTDIWADASPQDRYIPSSYWCLGGAWLCLHIWEHYLFTLDGDFLRWAYPILKDAAVFFEDFLIEVDGKLVVAPSTSCENTYFIPGTRQAAAICIGATWDSQILHELFTACAGASRVLGHDDAAANYESLLARLPQPKTGKHGQLLEWMEDFEEAEPGHRHISHAFGLFPGSSIHTPELKDALRVTLQRRLASGGGHTGWSAAWLLCLYARLRDPEAAHGMLSRLMSHSTLDNLFGDHPPFHIDGNFGLAAGVAEMLLQSQEKGVLTLLPCLPKQWEAGGSATGLCARAGIEVDLTWKDGLLVHARIHAKRTKVKVKCCIDENRLKGGPNEVELSLDLGQSITLSGVWTD
jgi:alpha-L-fucosidase 2